MVTTRQRLLVSISDRSMAPRVTITYCSDHSLVGLQNSLDGARWDAACVEYDVWIRTQHIASQRERPGRGVFARRSRSSARRRPSRGSGRDRVAARTRRTQVGNIY